MIGVFDSGCGGLSVLKEIVRLLPDEEYIYLADNAHCPYGEKSPEYITDRCREITRLLMSKGADIIVVACNTATAAAINTVRGEFDIKFIGMEPAVKPAALGTRTGVIGVLATAGTLKGSKYLASKGNYEDGCRIVEHVGEGFVELVEAGKLSGPETEATVKRSLTPLLDAGADTIVLGCTHYPFLLPTMQKIANVRFIDPAPAVARHLVYVMVQEGLLGERQATKALATVVASEEARALGQELPPVPRPKIELIATGDPSGLEALFETVFVG
ncbi:MAG: glutamate racemase [Bacteroidales bacterium]|nr:glutamate racemase [Bacteroidales bacterium]